MSALPKTKPQSIACEFAYTPNAKQQLSSLLVTWQDGQITEVKESPAENWAQSVKTWKEEYKGLTVYEGKLLTPAFINPHTHIAMNFFRGLSASASSTKGNMIEDLFYHVESHLSYEDVLAFSRMGAYENLLNGVGMVWDHYYHGLAVAHALADVGLTGVVAPTLQDLSGPGKDSWEEEWQQTHTINQSKDFRKNGIFAAFGPHASDTCSADLWTKVINEASKHKLPVHCHVAQSFEEYERIEQREGLSPVSWLASLGLFSEQAPVLAVHNIFSNTKDLEIMAQSKSLRLCFCPFSSLIFAIPSAINLWDQHQIPWCVGTDCVASNDSMNIQKELRFIAGMPMYNLSQSQSYLNFIAGQTPHKLKALNTERRAAWESSRNMREPKELLDKVWQIPGSLHPQLQAGQIAPGHLANLVIWDLNDPSIWPSRSLHTIAMGDTSRAIYQMICNGVFMGNDGQFESGIRHSTKFQEHLTEAKARFHSMLNRCGLKQS